MTAADELERVRMCLAEAGYDPNDVWIEPGEVDTDGQPFVMFFPERIPTEVLWRAGEIAEVDVDTICLACDSAAMDADGRVGIRHIDACRATKRLTLDCGVDRE